MVLETPIVYQNTVVDIFPASMHGADTDVATVNSLVLFQEPPLADDLDAIGATVIGDDGRLVSLRDIVEVAREEDVFRFSLTIPDKGTLLKNGAYSLVVLLPRDSVYDGEPIYEVELRDYTREPVPRVFGVYDLPSVGNRIGIAWYARQDPEDIVEYVYRKITGRA